EQGPRPHTEQGRQGGGEAQPHPARHHNPRDQPQQGPKHRSPRHRPPGRGSVHPFHPHRKHGEGSQGHAGARDRVRPRPGPVLCGQGTSSTRPAVINRTSSDSAPTHWFSHPSQSRNRRPERVAGTTPAPTSLVTATT